MTERKNLKVSPDVYESLAKVKGSKDTWDEFLSRMVNSVDQDQVHMDRATLRDFGDEEGEIKLRASPEGELEIRLTDDSGKSMGSVSFDSLEPGQGVEISIIAGGRIDLQ